MLLVKSFTPQEFVTTVRRLKKSADALPDASVSAQQRLPEQGCLKRRCPPQISPAKVLNKASRG